MGGRKETVSDEEILRHFMESEDPVLSTTEVADRLGFSNSGAWTRLDNLEDRGLIFNKKVGQTNIWWISSDGVEFAEGSDES